MVGAIKFTPADEKDHKSANRRWKQSPTLQRQYLLTPNRLPLAILAISALISQMSKVLIYSMTTNFIWELCLRP
jgi:hypothetical protein